MQSPTQSRDKVANHIIDDSGHNFDEAVMNILNDLAHEQDQSPAVVQSHVDDKRIDSFFDVPDDL